MPYKSEREHKKIPRRYDARVKLSLLDIKKIKKLYNIISQRKLAEMFGVSRRLIIFYGNDEAYKRNLELRKKRGGSKRYYDKEKHKESVKNTRMKRKILEDEGLLE